MGKYDASTRVGPARHVLRVEELPAHASARYRLLLSCGHVFFKAILRAGANEGGELKCGRCKEGLPRDPADMQPPAASLFTVDIAFVGDREMLMHSLKHVVGVQSVELKDPE